MNKNLVIGYAQTSVSAIGFGLMGVLGVIAYKEGFSTSDLLSWRFGIASAILILISFHQGLFKNISLKNSIICLLMGSIGYAGQALLFFSTIKYIDIGLATVLLYTSPIFVLVLSKIVDQERIGLRKLLLVSLSFIGLLLAIGFGAGNINWIGIVLGISTGIWYAIYLKISEKVMKNISPILISTLVCIGAFISFFSGAIATGGLLIPQNAVSWTVVVTIAIFSTVFAIVLLFLGIKKIGAFRAALISNLEPITAIILGFIFLSQTLSIFQALGMCLMLISVSMILSQNLKKDTEN